MRKIGTFRTADPAQIVRSIAAPTEALTSPDPVRAMTESPLARLLDSSCQMQPQPVAERWSDQDPGIESSDSTQPNTAPLSKSIHCT